MSYGRYYSGGSYSRSHLEPSGSTLFSTKYTSANYGSSSRKVLPDKFDYPDRRAVGSRSMLESSPKFNSYNDTPIYLPSRYGRAKTKDIVRPSTRSRQATQSMTRETTRRSRNDRDSSLPRSRKNTGIEYPELSSIPVTSYRPLPEFQTITSNYNKRTSQRKASISSNKSYSNSNGYNSSSSYLHNGSYDHYSNGYSPKIEVKRNIHNSNRQISVDDVKTDTYSPVFAQNRTSNNNNKDYESGSSSSTRSSINGRREDNMVSSTSSSRDVGHNGYSNRNSVTSTSSGRDSLVDANAGLVGLKNIGNTCFMNSIIQCLSNTKSLRDYCLNKHYLNDINNKSSSSAKEKLVEAFSDIIRQIWHPSSGGSPISTSAFKSKIQKFSNRFSGYEQQDSQEFMRFLIEGLHEDVNKVTKKHKDSIPNYDSLCDESKARKTWDFYLSKDNSFIVDLFMGQLRSSLKCEECGNVSTTFDPFWDLSLPIPKSSSYSLDKINLQQCLDNFTREEILDRDERPTCDYCKARRRMTKKFTIYKFPKILVIHLKRFNEGQRYRQKLSNEVDFPSRLEITSPVSTAPASFNLYAVSNHSGSCYGGHYTAYCKHVESGKWYSFNDSLVSAMSSSSVQSKEAYVLFYENLKSSRSHL
uniref:ubiquitin carboxyl-terminal hydrolase 2-like isoform X1 n=1 Tax=Styela clava TaxID=7725 RepID=UPI00193AD2A6|nr:ubiquitin carboxyl-terminal hydrolase 2-like isoform X1 [Styela clava]